MKHLFYVVMGVIVLAVPAGRASSQEKIDSAAIAQIKSEEYNRSQVMDILSYLSDVYGPRLSWSPEYREAAEWTSSRLKEWGLENVHYEKWGPAGKGWTLKRFHAQAIEPREFPLIAYPKAWSPGTRGIVRGDAVYLDAKTEADLEKFHGKLKNAFVLMSDPRTLAAHFQAEGSREADSSLLKMANAGMPGAAQRRGGRDSSRMQQFLNEARFNAKKVEFCQKEGAAVLVDGARGDGGTMFVQAASVPRAPESLADMFGPRLSPYDEKAPQILPQVSLAAEHYNRIVRMIGKGQHVRLEMNLEVEFTKADSSFNVIAEIPGTDLKDEVVMIGAHFDSWHSGTGATDNGTGSSVCLEAVRLIQSLHLKPRRTIRIGLWGGEEEGLLGSRSYVSQHFGQRDGDGMAVLFGGNSGTLKTKPEHEKFSVYFNNDNGSGKVRGVYLQGNDDARPIFRAWLAAFNDPTAQTLTLNNTGGTDHLSFDGVGLPGFQYIQDPLEYGTRTHHSNMDLYDRAQEEDLKQAAALMATFAYHAGMREGQFPRKPMPSPRGQRATGSN